MRVFPNPVHDYATVQYHFDGQNNSGVALEIYNSMGQRVYNLRLAAGADSQVINMSGMASGVYTVLAKSAQGILGKTILVKVY
jgi:hypothetical protein